MILTAHQPLYLPWLGLIHKVAISNKFCILDEVQFADRDFIHRNRILGQNGEPKWLTIPVEKKNHRSIKIKDVQIVDSSWVDAHLSVISNAYKNHEYFTDYFPDITSILKRVKSNYLIDFTIPVLEYLFEQFDCKPEISFQSDFLTRGKKSELIVELTNLHSASEYLSGTQGKQYLDLNAFEQEGISVAFQSYNLLPYPQQSATFQPGLSAIDLLFNTGEAARGILFLGNIKPL
jgi:hypothetical protein